MIPTLIVLGLLALGVGIVAFATRRTPTPVVPSADQDTAWNDPITPAGAGPVEDDPFAHAPTLTPPVVVAPAATETLPIERAS
ncbi:hypothetical protein [Brevundimonas sp. NIBR11]|uniref:hypothetical protein n=1 Tax=Brevundimonas sp. NIBR11 TaxID=3015999 RepID=UPI0022EFE4A6|nr:hypothetical protein [Brevundimonas sp. NIBR11]WGM31299.1 hypothetical protein KKHFBJBL_01543 [Brevundimonas sp. NIBR11]